MHDEKPDTMEDTMETLAIIHYITTIEGKQKARAVIHEWLRRILLRDEQLREMLLQYIASIDTSTFDTQTKTPIPDGEDEPPSTTSRQGIEFLLKFANSINTPLLDPSRTVETDSSMDEDVTEKSST